MGSVGVTGITGSCKIIFLLFCKAIKYKGNLGSQDTREGAKLNIRSVIKSLLKSHLLISHCQIHHFTDSGVRVGEHYKVTRQKVWVMEGKTIRIFLMIPQFSLWQNRFECFPHAKYIQVHLGPPKFSSKH